MTKKTHATNWKKKEEKKKKKDITSTSAYFQISLARIF